jgi:hypothetical protein
VVPVEVAVLTPPHLVEQGLLGKVLLEAPATPFLVLLWAAAEALGVRVKTLLVFLETVVLVRPLILRGGQPHP